MIQTGDLPRYAELPLLEALGLRTSWGLFGDPGGTLNFIDESAVRTASRNVQSGRVVSLSVESDLIDPPLYDRPPTEHVVTSSTRNIFEDELNVFNPQAGSQWDGLCHIRAREFGFYGGIVDEAEARQKLGMHHVASRGIVGRGLLIDVAGYYGDQWDPMEERAVGPDEIRAILDAQGSRMQAGDILCFRFGWVSEYRKMKSRGEDRSQVGITFAGLSAADELAEFLWDAKVAAVATDNPGVENSPGNRAVGSLHRKLIPGLGYPLAELLDLDGLAAACRERDSHDFLFTAAPLPLHGGVSSTANALAIL
jgi:kynurenine formamidase